MVVRVLSKTEIKRYRKLVHFARRQLMFIADRLSNEISEREARLFELRNWRLKRTLEKAVKEKRKSVPGDSVMHLVEDLRYIEREEIQWGDVGKEEMDYIRLVLNGLHDTGEFEEDMGGAPDCCH